MLPLYTVILVTHLYNNVINTPINNSEVICQSTISAKKLKVNAPIIAALVKKKRNAKKN